jgi:response regulator RpfG family c-di-GMP phosphodiesterase
LSTLPADRSVVLIVDDEVRILAALRRTLRKEGYEILVAESPMQAIEILEGRRVDLVLSDEKMPRMSGLDFLQEAKRLCPYAARMMITGWSKAISSEQLESLGVDALIPKPWDDAQLKESIRKALVCRV